MRNAESPLGAEGNLSLASAARNKLFSVSSAALPSECRRISPNELIIASISRVFGSIKAAM